MRNFLLSLALFFTPLVAFGGEPVKYEVPVQKIEGAETPVGLGDVVLLNLSKIAKLPENMVEYTVEWKVFDKGVEKKFFTNEKGIFFGSGIEPRKLIVFASVSYLYVEKDGEKFVKAGIRSQFLTVVVDVGGTGPGPNPGPDPNPTPNPTPVDPKFPDGVFKLASKTYGFAKKVEASRKVDAAGLSKVFTSQASKIAAGKELKTAKDIKDVLEETTEANRNFLGVNKDKWEDFFVALQEEIYTLYTDGKLKTKEDFSTAWKEISEGLSKVK
jgi:hypothetical protein